MPKKATDSLVLNGEMDIAIQKRETISNTSTPKQMIKKRADGFDYVEEAYMRSMLDKVYPDWSWLPAPDNAVQFLGAEWVVVQGVLEITEEESPFYEGIANAIANENKKQFEKDAGG